MLLRFLGRLIVFTLIVLLLILDGLLLGQQFHESRCGEPVYPELNGDGCGGMLLNYPFSLNGDGCGYPALSLRCTDDAYGRGKLAMSISNDLFIVRRIHYDFKYVLLVDADVDAQTCPQPIRNFSFNSFPPYLNFEFNSNSKITIFYNCTGYPEKVEQNLPCLDDQDQYPNNTIVHSFAFFSNEIPGGFNWYGSCKENVVVPVDGTTTNITEALKRGFILWWSPPTGECMACESSGGKCRFNPTTGVLYACSCKSSLYYNNGTCPDQKKNNTISAGIPTGLKVMIGVFAALGGILFILFLRCKKVHSTLYTFLISHLRKVTENQTNVDVFLESYGCLSLQRYSYSDIRNITNSFKDMLGQGGYGCVFKGKLPKGCLVAVKVLNGSKGNGDEFINEVATIGRTNHVNVVNLLGFCSEGTKRALVYEFMPNGSLEKYVYNEKNPSTTTPPLGWEKLYEIALGIARGLEYLHRGCNSRILHFDIKPHNILLDQDFCPKISDFGMAKLCRTKESVVSMLAARGTVGYIAPEVYCRNFGGVSHKSDVYSYGMMVLEMVGGRKNIDATVQNLSEVYFPEWAYNHLTREIDVEESSGEVFENETTKKMIIVALWCIQTQPVDRPSMTKVVEMLEGDLEILQMPPNPFQEPPPASSP